MKNLVFVFILFAVFTLNSLPLVVLAADESNIPSVLVNCGRGSAGPEDCTLIKLLELVDRVLAFFMYGIAFPLSIILIIYAGGRMVWYSNTNPGQAKAAKKILQNVLIGFALVFAANLIVHQVLDFFIDPTPDNPIQQAIRQVFRNPR